MTIKPQQQMCARCVRKQATHVWPRASTICCIIWHYTHTHTHTHTLLMMMMSTSVVALVHCSK